MFYLVFNNVILFEQLMRYNMDTETTLSLQ